MRPGSEALNAAALRALLQDDPGNPKPTAGTRIRRIEDLPSIWSIDAQPQGWLVDGLIPSEAITLLTGGSGVGKSMLALAMGGCVVWGASFLGRRSLQRPVLFLDRENPLSVVRDRIDMFAVQHHPDFRYWGTWLDEEAPNPGGELVRSFARSKPLIVLDSLVAFHGGSEQDATETRNFMQPLRHLAGAGATVLVLHHTGKGESTKDYRGSSDIKAAVDAAYVLEMGEGGSGIERLILRNFKMRCGEPPARLAIEFRNHRFEAGSDPFVNKTLEGRDRLRATVAGAAGIGRTALVTALTDSGITRARARELVDAALAEGEIVAAKGGRGGAETFRIAEQVEFDL